MARLVTYRCTNCKRTTTFQDNPLGFSTFGSCNITKNCTGELVALSKKQSSLNPINRQIDNTLLARYPRRSFVKFDQPFARRNWVVEHNLDVLPFVIAYNTSGTTIEDFTLEYPNRSTVVVKFNNPTAGIAHVIARTTQEDYDVPVPSQDVPGISLDALGHIAIATLTPISQPIIGNIFCYQLVTNTLLHTIPLTLAHTSTITIDVPWGTHSYVRFNGRRYNVRRTSISDQLSQLPNDAYFRVNLGTQSDTVFLLTKPPFASTDINTNDIVPRSFTESASSNATRVVNHQLMVANDLIEPAVAGIVKVV